MPLLPMPIRAKRFPKTQYLPRAGAATKSGINGALKISAPTSIALPMLPAVGDESKVEQTL